MIPRTVFLNLSSGTQWQISSRGGEGSQREGGGTATASEGGGGN